jgi:hypothetical protein
VEMEAQNGIWQYPRTDYYYKKKGIGNGMWFDPSTKKSKTFTAQSVYNDDTGDYSLSGFSTSGITSNYSTVCFPFRGKLWAGTYYTVSPDVDAKESMCENSFIKEVVLPSIYKEAGEYSLSQFHALETLDFYDFTKMSGTGLLTQDAYFDFKDYCCYDCEKLQYVKVFSAFTDSLTIGVGAFACEESLSPMPVLEFDYDGDLATWEEMTTYGDSCFKGRKRVIVKDSSGETLIMNATDSAYSAYFN